MNRVSYTTTMSAASAACDAILSLRVAAAARAVAPGMAGASSATRSDVDGSRRRERAAFIHESAYVDDGATIGAGTKIWHFCHVMPRRGDRRALQPRAERRRDERHADRQQLQDPEQRVDLRGRRARGRRVLRTVDGVHERDQSAQPRVAEERVPAHAREARRVDRRQRDDRLRRRRSASTRSSARAPSSRRTCCRTR